MGLFSKLYESLGNKYIKSVVYEDILSMMETFDTIIQGIKELKDPSKFIAHGFTWFLSLDTIVPLSEEHKLCFEKDISKLKEDIQILIDIDNVQDIPDFTSYSNNLSIHMSQENGMYFRYTLHNKDNKIYFMIHRIIRFVNEKKQIPYRKIHLSVLY